MSLMLALHLLSLGCWIGCIATETVFEHTTGRNTASLAAIAALHVDVDLWVEIPAFLLVLGTGAALLPQSPASPLFIAKIAVGLAAIGVNAACVRAVFARNNALRRGEFDRAAQVDRRQHRLGGALAALLMLAFALVALDRAGVTPS